MDFLLVAIGAAIGAPARFLTDRYVQTRFVTNHPRRLALGTFVVNVFGSAILAAVVARAGEDLALLLGIGFCGAYTTFSTFMAQTDESIREDWPFVAVANVFMSVVVCYTAFWATYLLLR